MFRDGSYRALKRELACRSAVFAAQAGMTTYIACATAADAKAIVARCAELTGDPLLLAGITVQAMDQEGSYGH